MSTTVAKTTEEYVAWVAEHEHHHGWWSGLGAADEALNLEGRRHHIKIPRAVHVPEAIIPSDYERTKRMFEPNPNFQPADDPVE